MKVGVYYRNSDVRVEERAVLCGDRYRRQGDGLRSCGSDLMEWYRIKRAPLVLGHEPAGIVTETGKLVTSVKPGDRVFVTHHVPCNSCYHCRNGHETACTTFQTVNNFDPGGFSQFLRVTGKSVETGTFVLPDAVSFEQATFIEPLGTAVRALRTVGLKSGQSLLVCGSGVAGLLIIKLAPCHGANP
jgi:L-iditol 2-dehydrogenase